MRSYAMWARLGLVLGSVALVAASPDVSLQNPAGPPWDDEISHLPGMRWKPNFKQFSGYLRAENDDSQSAKFMHYWFVESQSDASKDPIIVWVGSGGPECSSKLNLFYEAGPFRIEANGTISPNPFAWNRNASILFLDAPVGVGLSYVVNGSMSTNEFTTAEQVSRALLVFFGRYPGLEGNSLLLVGQGSGASFLPALARHISIYHGNWQLKGVAIGNGQLDSRLHMAAIVLSAYDKNLIGEDEWLDIGRTCCAGLVPSHDECPWTATSDCYQAISLGLRNVYNTDLNIDNIEKDCVGTNKMINWSKESSLMKSNDPICFDSSALNTYLNRADVRRAINVPKYLPKNFATCNSTISYHFGYELANDPLAMDNIINQLIHSNGLRFMFYGGNSNLHSPVLASRWLSNRFADEPDKYEAWTFDNQVAGYKQESKLVNFVSLLRSGMRVAADRPAQALEMFQKYFLSDQD